MASNRDILNAQRFNRQRLVMAFVAGTPGGREVEPSGTVRPLVGGVAVTLVILLVAFVVGRFTSSLPDGWEDSTLVVVRDEGTRYVTIDGRLRPITNLASARLLAESGSFQEVSVSADTLDGIERGSRVGLEDAPEELPGSDSLVSQGWSACSTTSTATSAFLGTSPQGQAAADHALVSVEGTIYLVAEGRSHEVPAEVSGAVLLALGLDSEPVVEVDATWLNLFDQGSVIEPFTLPEAGTPADALASTVEDAVSGMLLSVTDTSGEPRFYLVQDDGTLARLTEVEVDMYELGNPEVQAREVSAADLAQVATAEAGSPRDWPPVLGAGVGEGQSVCAVLQVDGSGGFTTGLGTADQLGDGGVSVEGGTGALVRATSGGSAGTVFLVTDAGRAWALGGDPVDTLQRLGYSEEDVASVPSPWLALFPTGPELSSQAVWEGVAQQ
ncbi:type VII secretion protein EccB [Actinomyces sp. 2119]|uniref:Type VII secretion protein EccB n=1 Tax=Actinomyces lilanjuaniae TaxID=2321394 RepID=A0ABM6Z134_9ACTO|nr:MULTISPECIES: type VII secretion protein EccB [Actinomyces]AYD88944.1 type VII secretion protein EccB [Actinomyces lilanjuaniae]RJF41219.1 type VII secretion protein EccB [Actinomyces sp. 2119]